MELYKHIKANVINNVQENVEQEEKRQQKALSVHPQCTHRFHIVFICIIYRSPCHFDSERMYLQMSYLGDI